MKLSEQLDHLFICYDGGDVDDRSLADQIALATMPFCEPVCVTIEQLTLADHPSQVLRKANVQASIRLGPRILIMSRGLALDAKGPQVLAQFLGSEVQHRLLLPVYCVSREIGSNAAGSFEIPAAFRENVIIRRAETDLELILTELRDYFTDARSTRPTYGDLALAAWKYFFKDFRARVAYKLSRLLVLMSTAGLLATFPLAFVWWKHWWPSWWLGLAVLSGFGSGICLHQLRPNDLWPYMLGAWKLPRQAPTKPVNRNPSFIMMGCIIVALCQRHVAFSIVWVVVGLVSQTLIDWWLKRVLRSRNVYSEAAGDALGRLGREASPDSCVSLSDLELFLYMHGSGDYVNWAMLLSLEVWISPTIVLTLQGGVAAIIWVTLGVIVGYAAPSGLARGLREYVAAKTERLGLTASYAARLGQPLYPRPDPIGSQLRSRIKWPARLKRAFDSFPASESERVSLWWRRLRQPDDRFITAFVRPFRTPPDYVFISYAWKDDLNREATIPIADACQATGIDYFLDKRNRMIGQDYFRAELAASIAKATHFFLIVSASTARGRTVMREIEVAMTRWIFEMTPTIICVVDSGVAEALRADTTLPLALRFLLTFCPQMTPNEAACPELVRYVVEFTRREAKLHDWLPFVLSPGGRIAAALRLPGFIDA